MTITDIINKTKTILTEIDGLDKSLEKNKKIREKKIKREYVFYVDDLLEEAGYKKYDTGINKTKDDYHFRINEDKSATLIIRDDKLKKSGKFNPFLAYINLPNEEEVNKFEKNRHLLQYKDDYLTKGGLLALSLGGGGSIGGLVKSTFLGSNQTPLIAGVVAGLLTAGGIMIYRGSRVKISQNYFNKNYKNKIVEGPDKVLASEAFKPLEQLT